MRRARPAAAPSTGRQLGRSFLLVRQPCDTTRAAAGRGPLPSSCLAPPIPSLAPLPARLGLEAARAVSVSGRTGCTVAPGPQCARSSAAGSALPRLLPGSRGRPVPLVPGGVGRWGRGRPRGAVDRRVPGDVRRTLRPQRAAVFGSVILPARAPRPLSPRPRAPPGGSHRRRAQAPQCSGSRGSRLPQHGNHRTVPARAAWLSQTLHGG